MKIMKASQFNFEFLWYLERILEWNWESTQKQPPEVFCKKLFLEITQNSQENTCARVSFLIKFQASGV